MGFCGGSWDQVTAPCRIVIPRVDDCVSLLLQRGDGYVPNLKEMGHLYLYEKDVSDAGAEEAVVARKSVKTDGAKGGKVEPLK